MTAPAQTWRSRIVGHDDVDPVKLMPNPRNWRRHSQKQKAAVSDMLDQVGWVQDVIVNRRTGLVVDGHLRVEIARSRGETSIPVVYVDLSPSEEALVLASIDPLAAMAETDVESLNALIAELTVDGPSLTALLADLAVVPGAEKAWQPPSQGAIDAEASKLATAFEEKVEAQAAKHVGVICPECGYEFSYRSDLKE